MSVNRDVLSPLSSATAGASASPTPGTRQFVLLQGGRRQWAMPSPLTPTEFEQRFIQRTRAVRERAFATQAQMAIALGIPAERYKKYEQRTPLPHSLIPRFCLIARITIAELFDVDKPLVREARARRAS